eukprot:comp21884_c0_seq1/m.49612 comp21884_c0_seq1/g.49612  ORF comp21884_c0_seq1/g.49612 comp21884_c0_seq1/m.49612 type:complete len:339 (+) comp21884_c0_seq1:456-1472(+)
MRVKMMSSKPLKSEVNAVLDTPSMWMISVSVSPCTESRTTESASPSRCSCQERVRSSSRSSSTEKSAAVSPTPSRAASTMRVSDGSDSGFAVRSSAIMSCTKSGFARAGRSWRALRIVRMSSALSLHPAVLAVCSMKVLAESPSSRPVLSMSQPRSLTAAISSGWLPTETSTVTETGNERGTQERASSGSWHELRPSSRIKLRILRWWSSSSFAGISRVSWCRSKGTTSPIPRKLLSSQTSRYAIAAELDEYGLRPQKWKKTNTLSARSRCRFERYSQWASSAVCPVASDCAMSASGVLDGAVFGSGVSGSKLSSSGYSSFLPSTIPVMISRLRPSGT